jgi:hypothetical protein
MFTSLITADEEARKTSLLFATYMQAIDSGSTENRYSLIDSDCQVNKNIIFVFVFNILLLCFVSNS